LVIQGGSLWGVESKLQESFIVNWLNEDINGKIMDAQYSGQSGSSAVLALIYLVHKWHTVLDTPGFVIRILFLDFRKAYDLIDHNILLENCCKIGINSPCTGHVACFISEWKNPDN
jgi:phage-related holin